MTAGSGSDAHPSADDWIRRSQAPLVDTHAHIFHSGLPLSPGAWHTPNGDATLADYLAVLDRTGVHFAVLAAASIFGDYNDYMVDATERHKRLRTTVIVEPDIDIDALRAMDRRGVVGIRLQFRSLKQTPDLDSFAYRKLFRRVADLGWHVHLHDEGERLPSSIVAIERHGVRLVIDHFGRPDLSLGTASPGFTSILQAIDRGKTWVKLSAAFRLTPLASLRPLASKLIENAGPERLLWGSDWPFVAHEQRMTYTQAVEDYRELVPDPVLRTAIDRTALKFYFQ